MKGKGGKDWSVYILRCGYGSFYTRIAKNVEVRVKQHNEGKGATYTRTQEGLTHSEALIREAQIKPCLAPRKRELTTVKPLS